MTAALDAARTRLSRAQHALHEILSAGGNTAEARARVEVAQADRDRLTEAENAAAGQLAAKAAASIQREAEVAVQAARQALQREIDAFVAVPAPTVELATAHLTALGHARERLAGALEVESTARQAVNELQGRAADITAKRNAVMARRVGGSASSTDAGTVALYDADLAGLQELIERARQQADGPVQAAIQARAAVASCEAAVSADAAQARAVALAQVCQALETALVRAAEALYPLRGTVPAWRPGIEIKHLLAYGSPQHRSAA